MDHLHRQLAPIGDDSWAQIDEEAAQALRHHLAARPLVDFVGPKGWTHASEPLGRIEAVEAQVAGTQAALRVTQPLVEIRVPFEVSYEALDQLSRGAPDPDLDSVVDAAKTAALAEDRAVFDGYEPFAITGITGSSPHEPIPIASDYDKYPASVAQAVALLKRGGIGGPYAIALGERCYTGVIETTEHGGYPLLEHLKLILGGPVVWAPAVDGAVVLSVRGGDYQLVTGEDFAIGYRASRAEGVELYIEETFTLVVNEPRAGVALRYL